MTPRSKSYQLMYKYYKKGLGCAKSDECALIAVNEIIEIASDYSEDKELTKKYWQRVKQQIEKRLI